MKKGNMFWVIGGIILALIAVFLLIAVTREGITGAKEDIFDSIKKNVPDDKVDEYTSSVQIMRLQGTRDEIKESIVNQLYQCWQLIFRTESNGLKCVIIEVPNLGDKPIHKEEILTALMSRDNDAAYHLRRLWDSEDFVPGADNAPARKYLICGDHELRMHEFYMTPDLEHSCS
ncbi:hypothetical protein COV18_03630 [Candidatus Woesearchaeota archaeon CG10_big_fil_rev_8_21_14_0_10_37_12]|nr:MAG: hypothetical protein COV18_03630 [Candidatus Woesearchaeota archaeon CG10_big_fil_rev_8_21_14_0_10_37_12]